MFNSVTEVAIKIIENVKKAELCRDIDTSISAFREIWPDIEKEPDFSAYSNEHRATFYRLAGFFLAYYGKSRNIRLFQERGKNLLTKAIALFNDLDESEKAAEANVMLAICYWNEGSILECDAILDQTASEFEGNQLNPIYLQILINRLMTRRWKGEYQIAHQLIDEIRVPIELCNDLRLKVIFNTEAGILHRLVGKFEESIAYYNEAIKFAQQSDNQLYVALNSNNLAMVHNQIRQFVIAHASEDKAIEIARRDSHLGWLANFLDTKCLIYFAEGKFEHALSTIDESIELFRKGEDSAGLIEALWNKVRCLIELKDKEEALYVFAEVTELARRQIGDFGLRKFVKELAKIFHGKGSGTFEEEIQRFKRMELEEALNSSNNDITMAANFLKISEAKLVRMLSHEFPDLLNEEIVPTYDLPEAIDSVTSESETVAEPDIIQAGKHISILDLSHCKITLPPELEGSSDANPRTFYISSEKMHRAFGLRQDAVVAVLPVENEIPNDEYLVLESAVQDIYYLSRLSYDKSLDFHLLIDEETPLTLGDVNIIGRAIGYIPFEEIDSETLNFRLLPR